jgi:hypothetical protein
VTAGVNWGGMDPLVHPVPGAEGSLGWRKVSSSSEE